MPELPEVETMRRGVFPIVGQRIVAAERPPCDRKPILFEPSVRTFHKRVVGKRIESIERLGKRVLICLEEEQTIVIEPRMTGLVLLSDPPSDEHLRFRLRLDEGPVDQVLFWDRRGLGTVRLYSASELQTQVRDRLGPDALAVQAEELRMCLGKSKRPIKVALLDQSAVAGIGNLYAAEILFVSGIDPRTRCDRLSKPQWERIEHAIGRVLSEAIAHEGSTLSDGTYRNALNAEGGYQNYHRVYDRAESKCRRCEEGTIRRIVQAQRSTFFCPVCQRKSGRHATIARDPSFA